MERSYLWMASQSTRSNAKCRPLPQVFLSMDSSRASGEGILDSLSQSSFLFVWTGSAKMPINSTCDTVECELVGMAFQNSFHSEIERLYSLLLIKSFRD